jgi:general secretion pathway protein G
MGYIRKTVHLTKTFPSRVRKVTGFTIIEILLAVAVIGVVVAIALPTYRSYIARAQTAEAIIDINVIEATIKDFELDNGRLPNTLSDIGWTKLDKWGNAYYYLNMDGAPSQLKRKDRSLHPLNSDYDLYSSGPDGNTSVPLTASASQDDIIRANNGAFVGVARNY